MEINFNIKVKGGKRTPVEVTVYGTAVNEKVIEFSNGKTVSESQIAIWLQDNLVIALKQIQEQEV